MAFLALGLYCAAIVTPAAYLLKNGLKMRKAKAVMLGLALQLFWSLLVWTYVSVYSQLGHKDGYTGWVLLIPVDVFCLLYFVCVIGWNPSKRQ